MADEHTSILAECVQRFDNLSEKLEMLIARSDRINGRYENHLEESTPYRSKVDRHEHRLELMEKSAEKALSEKWNSTKAAQWRIGLIIGGILSLFNLGIVVWTKLNG